MKEVRYLNIYKVTFGYGASPGIAYIAAGDVFSCVKAWEEVVTARCEGLGPQQTAHQLSQLVGVERIAESVELFVAKEATS